MDDAAATTKAKDVVFGVSQDRLLGDVRSVIVPHPRARRRDATHLSAMTQKELGRRLAASAPLNSSSWSSLSSSATVLLVFCCRYVWIISVITVCGCGGGGATVSAMSVGRYLCMFIVFVLLQNTLSFFVFSFSYAHPGIFITISVFL